MNNLLAHTENKYNKCHLLIKHNNKTGDIMSLFSINEDCKNIFRYTGIWHDFGKYQPEFQCYLREGGRRGSVYHAIWGAYHSKNKGLIHSCIAISGHHSGLPNFNSLKTKLQDDCLQDKEKYEELIKFQVQNLSYEPKYINNDFFNNLPTVTQKELFVRYLFSALVDADWLDTEAHFDGTKSESRCAPVFDATYFENCLESQYSKFEDSELNALRTMVREYALTKANMPRGFFSLTLPTGMGKTLCSIAWAIKHACAHNLKRIIIVLPYINIIDQTVMVLKSLFGDEYVLEHHSNVEIVPKKSEDYDKKQLAAENWDYPVIVTTSIQFFESLFANKPSICRKVHNIKDSVVIFDEVQTLPKHLVEPTLTMLNDVKELLGATFLFCTATQPAFERRDGFVNGIEKIEPLVENPIDIFKQCERVIYRGINDYLPIEMDELADIVNSGKCSALVVFNTKKKAAVFHNLIKNDNFYTIHLSTAMCPAHRKKMIKRIKQLLKNGERIIVSSTQLIEAGVDLDFPAVYRETAPLESIIQSAGRCNREGKLPLPGIVSVFNLTDSGKPDKSYNQERTFAISEYKGKEERFLTYDFFTEYYSKVMNLFYNADKNDINSKRANLLFEDIACSYKLIDDNTISLFIMDYDTESRELYEKLKHKEFLSRTDRRIVNKYSVQVYDKFINDYSHHIVSEKNGLLVWNGKYNDATGIESQIELDTLIH